VDQQRASQDSLTKAGENDVLLAGDLSEVVLSTFDERSLGRKARIGNAPRRNSPRSEEWNSCNVRSRGKGATARVIKAEGERGHARPLNSPQRVPSSSGRAFSPRIYELRAWEVR